MELKVADCMSTHFIINAQKASRIWEREREINDLKCNFNKQYLTSFCYFLFCKSGIIVCRPEHDILSQFRVNYFF